MKSCFYTIVIVQFRQLVPTQIHSSHQSAWPCLYLGMPKKLQQGIKVVGFEFRTAHGQSLVHIPRSRGLSTEAMLKSLLVVLLFYLLPLVVESNSQTITPKESKVGSKTCEQLLEKFWESNGMNIEGEYELITIQKLNSKSEALNQILNEREQLVEYESESALR